MSSWCFFTKAFHLKSNNCSFDFTLMGHVNWEHEFLNSKLTVYGFKPKYCLCSTKREGGQKNTASAAQNEKGAEKYCLCSTEREGGQSVWKKLRMGNTFLNSH
ncbi:UNVERIFIED_CONTAM: hypothetical protein FKN15_056315 [Acipenser sinensis]